jgi:hypothetical protein
MIVVINKSFKKEEINEALKKLRETADKKPVLTDFFGKLKGAFGDGVKYQQELRS